MTDLIFVPLYILQSMTYLNENPSNLTANYLVKIFLRDMYEVLELYNKVIKVSLKLKIYVNINF